MILLNKQSEETRHELAEVVSQLAHNVAPRDNAVAAADEAAAGAKVRRLWDRLSSDIGVLGLAVPEERGGAGAGYGEIGVVVEALARHAAPAPSIGSFVGVEVLLGADDQGAAGLLEDVLGAEVEVCVARSLSLDVAGTDGVLSVSGDVPIVIDGSHADWLLGWNESTAQWLAVDLAGADKQRLETLDLVRDCARIVVDGAPGFELAIADGKALLGRVDDVARFLLAAEQVAVAEQSLADAVGYAKVREQFRRQIGSFQGLKHGLADVAVEADLARTFVEHAVWALEENPASAKQASAMALRGASRAATFATAENVQTHGGIGFSWEHTAHLYFRKARSNEFLWGSADTLVDDILGDLNEVSS